MLNPVSKSDLKTLRALARDLPITTYPVKEIDVVQVGNQQIRTGNDTGVLMYRVNHVRRLTDAYKRFGYEAVKEYCRGVIELHKISAEPINLHPQWI